LLSYLDEYVSEVEPREASTDVLAVARDDATSALAEKLLDAGALSEKLALRRGTTFASRTELPPPRLRVGWRALWHGDDVDAWVADLPERDRARLDRRRAKRGLAAL
jgi:hypothetical protein